MDKKWSISTLAVQGNYNPDETGSRTIPIHQTASYNLGDADRAARLYDLKEEGNIYTRINNPTNTYFEDKMNLLEGGVAALSTSSGHSAVFLALTNICSAGDHIVAASNLYGGTYTLFKYTLAKFGIEATFVNPELPIEELAKYFKSNTKALFGETIGNPDLKVLDFEKFSKLAKQQDVPFIVDNTFATPYLLRPFEFGVDITIYSATKYIGGHGNSLGGIIIDSGNYNWDNGKFPCLTEEDPSYHGIKYVEEFGELAFITKARVQHLRDIGATTSPFNSFLFHLGLETLPLRMDKHSANALELAKYLEKHEMVEWVSYPLLESHPTYLLAKKYLVNGASGVLTFGIKGGKEAGKKFINSVKLASHVPNIGDTRTLVIHPASTTHAQLTEKEQIATGVFPDLIRVSVGIEDIKDIKADFDYAIRNI